MSALFNQTHGEPHPYIYENQVFAAGLKGERPAITFDTTKWSGLAKEILNANSFSYVGGNAGAGLSCEKNKAAFQKWSILPSRLQQTAFPKLETTVLGEKLAYPVAVAPVGVQKIFHPDGEVAVAQAATATGLPYILSTATCTSIEEAAKASGSGQRWYQLYWPARKHDKYTASLLKRAQANGFTALFVTVDTYTMGWRPQDLDHGYNPFVGVDNMGVEIGFSDPVFQADFREQYGKDIKDDMGNAAKAWASIMMPGVSNTWEDIKFLQDHWHGPIVLKGIQTVSDAKKAVAAGVQGIVVSNHGGRQQEGVRATLDALPAIVDAVGDKIDVLFDSGIRNGADMVKALAFGAKAVLIGRPYVYGLAIGGRVGVEHVLKALLGEMEMTMHQAGIASVDPKDLNRDVLVRED